LSGLIINDAILKELIPNNHFIKKGAIIERRLNEMMETPVNSRIKEPNGLF
jgi:hypothetical protein